MPYDKVESLPPAVKKLPSKKQRQWMEVFNSAHNSCIADGGGAKSCEESAFAQAWGVVKKAYDDEASASGGSSFPSLEDMDLFCSTVEKFEASRTDLEKSTKSEILVKFVGTLRKGLVYGVVYAPGEVDTQGDFTSSEEIECAAHGFLPDAVMNIHHQTDLQDVQVVESYIAPCNFSMNGQLVTKGSWVLVTKILNEELKKAIAEGEITGYSLEGTATRTEGIQPAVKTVEEINKSAVNRGQLRNINLSITDNSYIVTCDFKALDYKEAWPDPIIMTYTDLEEANAYIREMSTRISRA
jgi:cation transport regulator ChaB